jgi:hypothetical protein
MGTTQDQTETAMRTRLNDHKVNTTKPNHSGANEEQRQPHERDESPEGTAKPRGVMQQAADDLAQGLADTDLRNQGRNDQASGNGKQAHGPSQATTGRRRRHARPGTARRHAWPQMKTVRLAPAFILATALLPGQGYGQGQPMPPGFGPRPVLPAPSMTLLPKVNIAPAIGWPNNVKPQAAPGLAVSAYASGLLHPRWVYVLPNGDVLVAETNAPERPEENKGIKGAVMKMEMKRAGAAPPSANRITLLRGVAPDGTAQLRTVFLEGLHSPFGMALVGNDLYVANTDAVVRFPYQAGQTSIKERGVTVMELPAGPLNHHWTKNLVGSPDGSKLYVSVGSNSNAGERGMDKEDGRAAIWCSPPACATRSAWPSIRPAARCGPRSTSATNWATSSSPTT